MTKIEFENRAMEVSNKEFEAINEVYMNCDLDKDEFCKMWCKMNAKRVKAYKEAKKAEAIQQTKREKLWQIVNRQYIYEEFCSPVVAVLDENDINALLDAGIKLDDDKALSFFNSNGIISYLPRVKQFSEVYHEIKMMLAA